ncbi:MAG: HAMP domain-containing histidine kinase [Coriobacteriia bacterium]|nr:HAMP domain-containing histidine kinase [Coriobacteriia bacterium]MCL2870103.1 HAMP domain-containing histidine kinase [Coriobacteriia bacterium]
MKWFSLLLAVVVAASGILIVQITSIDYDLDRVEINRVARAIEASWPDALYGRLPESSVSYFFVESGQALHAYRAGQDVLVDVSIDSEIVGTVVVSNEAAERLEAMRSQLIIFFSVLLILIVVCSGLFALYLHRSILHPFHKLESFATRVAQGDLDIPLEMDKENRFGAFSESFDLMREQLALARENERLANISKKELVASLSHDIKTPVASIKAITELHQVKHGATSEMKSIAERAESIDILITNMFTSALEELEQLEVHVGEVTSVDLGEYIRASDYQNRIRPFILPECVIAADNLRLQQVIDNVVGNSYKYADTPIEVSGDFEGPVFVLTVRDFGPGVSSEELPLLREKYYRASNSEGKDGAGLGLYLAHYFLSEMGGSLAVENDDGLVVTLRLKV